MKKAALVLCVIFLSGYLAVLAAPELNARNAILTELSSDTVLFELNADERVPIASITKIMTALLAMEAIDRGELNYTDMITVSAHAASIGGSQIYAKEGELLSVDEVLKGIMIASGNDAAVIMAEHLGGTYENFIEMMNKRAGELGMKDTHFASANGLEDDVTKNYSTARDVAIMSRELIKHEDIKKYTLTRTDTIRDGKFNLTNTNKLILTYEGLTGLKTGYTTEALYCLSATAQRNGFGLCAVNLGCPDTNDRFTGCAALLDYGFDNFEISDTKKSGTVVCEVPVKRGAKRTVNAVTAKDSIAVTDKKIKTLEAKTEIKEGITAPVKKGDVVGKFYYTDGENKYAETDLLAANDVEVKTFFGVLADFGRAFLGIY